MGASRRRGTLEAMEGRTLTPVQARRVLDALYPHLGYLLRLQRRMEHVGFLPGNPLLQRVAAAYDSLHALCVELHYQSCSSGVGRPSPPAPNRQAPNER